MSALYLELPPTGAESAKVVIRIDPMQVLLGLSSGDLSEMAVPGIYVPLDFLESLDTNVSVHDAWEKAQLQEARECADITNQDIVTQISLTYPVVFSSTMGFIAGYALKHIGHIIGVLGIAAIASSEGLYFALHALVAAPPPTSTALSVVEIWDDLTKSFRKEKRPRRPPPRVLSPGGFLVGLILGLRHR
ncbi:hypothetical protein SPRG_20780 [Saprolegnia parasitica CBS 223.65]|uniref:Uncharacterized protein n=1 Tax=Saprolegnia parasitica (strain CBS 223.65) TaxID=695850 RepID=A0A067CEJ6_SAPPC|nr:hypothetical protein SPRG_20780 [Saprolegnia parasitica CBS 223.65]KDO25202.1 hypothetical protein SPRG_20780 [Saprolegnia parasitica CBS 223.65]|eukprot:XP_012204108.1 hypothetical protein SPRG_20780 [Saprolegnia parasitica CBS 223.65]